MQSDVKFCSVAANINLSSQKGDKKTFRHQLFMCPSKGCIYRNSFLALLPNAEGINLCKHQIQITVRNSSSPRLYVLFVKYCSLIVFFFCEEMLQVKLAAHK